MDRKQLELIVPQLPKHGPFDQFFNAEFSREVDRSSCDGLMNIRPVVTCLTAAHQSHQPGSKYAVLNFFAA